MRIFIYNSGQGISQESVHDLKRLYTEYRIFDNPVVLECDFTQNFDGLNQADNPTLIIPGGHTQHIGRGIFNKGLIPKIKKLHQENGFNVAGACAGAFLGADDADIFENKIFDPYYKESLKETYQCSFGLTDSYTALGSFTPNNSFTSFYTLPAFPPYATTVTFTEHQQTLPQLFVLGCGFERNTAVTVPDCEVVATYADNPSYSFFYQKPGQARQEKKIEQLPAIITRKPEDKRGGLFLSGVHIEACVQGSKMLEFFNPETANQKTFSQAAYQSLVDTQAETREVIMPILQRSFGVKK